MPGRVRITVSDGELRVANTGAPLTVDGVAALASLRASAKRDEPGATGRFGVGFAAVLGVSEEPRVVSTTGGVRFSATATAEEVDRLPGPAAERKRRDGRVPVLRLVWPVDETVPAGWSTEVRLPVDGADRAAALLDDARRTVADLLLALPGLDAVEVDGTTTARTIEPDGTVRIGTRRWRTVSRSVPAAAGTPDNEQSGARTSGSRPVDAGPTGAGPTDAGPTGAGLTGAGPTYAGPTDAGPTGVGPTDAGSGAPGAGVSGARTTDARSAGTAPRTAAEDRVEEATLVWALPLDGPGLDDGENLHAPTATAEQLSLPARLLAPFPLDPDRRRIRTGPRVDALVELAGEAYADLVRATPPRERAALVPEPGFPRSPLDGRLRDAVIAALTATPWMPGATGEALAPRRAEWLDLPGADGVAELLAAPGPDDSAPDRDDTAPDRDDTVPEPNERHLRARSLPGRPVRSESGTPGDAGIDAGTGAGTEAGIGAAAGALASAGRSRRGGRPHGFSPAFANLLASGSEPPPGLGVTRVSASEMTDRLLEVEAPPGWWHRLYDALAGPARTVPGLLDELRTLPVPLADGRLVRGPASVLLPESHADPAVTAVAALGLSGLHVAAPEAAHPLLQRLGAGEADREALRAHPALRAAVDGSLDDADAGLDVEPLAHAVLALLDGAEPAGWAGALALTDDEGAPARADELVLPDAAIRGLLHPDAPVGVLDARWTDAGRDALVAAGILDGFAVTDALDALDDGDRWADDHPDATVVGVRDLDLVADDAWPAALRLLAGARETRSALLAPDGYTAWWLGRHARLGGYRPGHWALATAGDTAGLVDPVPVTDVDDAVLAAIGVRDRLHVDDATGAADLLDRLADPGRTPSPSGVAAAHRALTEAVAAGRIETDDVDPPARVRTVTGDLVAADDAVVLDAPWALPALDAGAVAGGDPELLADVLDLPLASETVAGRPVGTGTARRWSEIAEVAVACHTLGVGVPDGELLLHERLEIDLTSPRTARITVPTWPGDDGRWHASDPLRALLAIVADDPDNGPAGGSEPAVATADVLGSGREPVEPEAGVDVAPSGRRPLGAHLADGAAGHR